MKSAPQRRCQGVCGVLKINERINDFKIMGQFKIITKRRSRVTTISELIEPTQMFPPVTLHRARWCRVEKLDARASVKQ